MSDKKLLTRLDLQNIADAKSDIETRIVDVSEWGGSVVIRGLTGTQRSEYETSLMVERGGKRSLNLRNAKAKLVALSMIDPNNGEYLYSTDEVHILAMRSSSAIEKVFTAASELNGLTDKDVEKMANGLEENPNGDTGLDSH